MVTFGNEGIFSPKHLGVLAVVPTNPVRISYAFALGTHEVNVTQITKYCGLKYAYFNFAN